MSVNPVSLVTRTKDASLWFTAPQKLSVRRRKLAPVVCAFHAAKVAAIAYHHSNVSKANVVQLVRTIHNVPTDKSVPTAFASRKLVVVATKNAMTDRAV